MGKVLIIGAGGVGTDVAHKVAQNPDVFTEIMIASRTKSKCDAVGIYLGGFDVRVTDCLDNSVTFGLGAAGYHDFCKHIRILSQDRKSVV